MLITHDQPPLGLTDRKEMRSEAGSTFSAQGQEGAFKGGKNRNESGFEVRLRYADHNLHRWGGSLKFGFVAFLVGQREPGVG